MVRLMLTLAPVACILGAVGMSGVLNAAVGQLKKSWRVLFGPANGNPGSAVVPVSLSTVVAGGIYVLTIFYALHATFVSSEAYSSPSIVLGACGWVWVCGWTLLGQLCRTMLLVVVVVVVVVFVMHVHLALSCRALFCVCVCVCVCLCSHQPTRWLPGHHGRLP
jgi:hypothetical protein